MQKIKLKTCKKSNLKHCKYNEACRANRGMGAKKAVDQHILDHVHKILEVMKCEKGFRSPLATSSALVQEIALLKY